MRTTATLVLTAALGLGVVGQASAADRLSDSAYMTAMRCRGFAEARQIDATSLDAVLKSQRGGRDAYIGDRGARVRKEAARDARSTSVGRKARVDAELAGVCRAYLEPASALAGAADRGA